MRDRVILDLCAGSGAWSQPYVEAGYIVRRITLPQDVRLIEYDRLPVWGILAAPPCTVFAASGARWERSEADMLAGLSVVDACLRAVTLYRPTWWALENPVGSLRRWLGPPRMTFDPWEYGDPYRKHTLLWGDFKPPALAPVTPTKVSPIHWMPPSADRAAKRSITPPGFSRAFMESNP